jgi:hypothetical protein
MRPYLHRSDAGRLLVSRDETRILSIQRRSERTLAPSKRASPEQRPITGYSTEKVG